ncbi:class I SAM-dependent methyltransferase [Variovorax sp. J22R115]|uniref:class I SAM-dependent methyltransferase n=1 Tax=Variovorax sp. J22R115 TaxID=3053509 RepID=UPI002575B883|nr:class I SAM-dependent methyltransferase [Variovorax sp. J22R115]MDM0049723.1 methyltransferase domain-containing protein [Variovorax sp. J22R115]
MTRTPIDADAFREFERASHDEIAEGYRDFFAAVTGYATEPLLDAAAVGAGMRVLDVATGPGVVASRAARRGASPVVGVDLAPRMVAIAATQYPSLDFREGDAEDLPFTARSFDAVVSNFGIGHFPDPERAVREFARVLAPHGVVALSWWDVPARHRLNGIFFDAVNEAHACTPADLPAGPPMFRFSDDHELSELLRAAGLTRVAVQAYAFIHRLASADELWNGILGGTVRTSIGIRRQPMDVRDRIRAAYDRLVQPYAQCGSIEIPVAFKIAVGRRQSE